MVNKKGIIRIIEASIAILIIFIVVLTFSMTRKASTEKDLSSAIVPLLEEIAKNNSMREQIVNTSVTNEIEENATIRMILDFLSLRVTDPNIGRAANVCDVGALCGFPGGYPSNMTGNVYAGSRIISSSIFNAKSKRISIFLWFNK